MGNGASIGSDEFVQDAFDIVRKEYFRLRDLQMSENDIFNHLRDIITSQMDTMTERELEAINDEDVSAQDECLTERESTRTLDESRIDENETTDTSAPPQSGSSITENNPTTSLQFSGNDNKIAQNLTPEFTNDVLINPKMLRLFVRFCERNKVPHGVDRLRFWVEIDQLQALPSHLYTVRRLQKIYDKFLSPEATSPICVTSTMLNGIEKALEIDSVSSSIYTGAQAICLTALEKSVYPRFRESFQYRQMLEFSAQNAGVDSSFPGSKLGHENTLAAILNHPAKLQFLKSYCVEAVALENLLFYLEVEDCKRLPNLSFIAQKTRKVYDRYCTPTSRNYIAINEAALTELHQAVESNSTLFPRMFYDAQANAFSLISEELWRQFSRTQEYLDCSLKIKAKVIKHQAVQMQRKSTAFEAEQKNLEMYDEAQLIEIAMKYPVMKLIPIKYVSDNHSTSARLMAQEDLDMSPNHQLDILLQDSIAKRYFKEFMNIRQVGQYVAFLDEVNDYKLLPGVEYLQHAARKINQKYIIPSARLQVDMSREMREEVADKLLHPSVDMFKKISNRIRNDMLRDSLPRFVRSNQYQELAKAVDRMLGLPTTTFGKLGIGRSEERQQDSEQAQASLRQMEESKVELKEIGVAANTGKLELNHLDMLLRKQMSSKYFKDFLELTHCSENLMLWEEIEHFRRLPSYQIVIRSARKLYDKFLSPSSKSQVALAKSTHDRIFGCLDTATRNLFNKAERECYDFMRNTVLPDFTDSRVFMAVVGAWAAVDEQLPAQLLRGEFEIAFLRHRFHLMQECKRAE
uniref:Regulator of G protein signaling putative n=1 Tax=Albugo laibachii Nc14 TaxID=890382 RepID=F0W608_9STRA|nr:Regulator of G protein signaling putative [Albugo laibachii Nc14]|eukprot:CCA16550.1 Regulator of G protein signaling putative [Albugo laibachii Nc14]